MIFPRLLQSERVASNPTSLIINNKPVYFIYCGQNVEMTCYTLNDCIEWITSYPHCIH